MDLVEEGMIAPPAEEGRAGARPWAYALFADAAKAYGQVRRDGLACACAPVPHPSLGLHSMGVRGAMWHIIQEWPGNPRARTTRNGVRSLRMDRGRAVS